MWKIAVIIGTFLSSLGWLYFLASSASSIMTTSQDEDSSESSTSTVILPAKFPSNLEELQETARILTELLSDFSSVAAVYVFVLFISAYLFKQAFAIPGSVFLNVLAGAVFGVAIGFPLTCLLTAVGATCCYLLARFAGQDLAQRYFPSRVSSFHNKLKDNAHRLPFFLLFLRLFPVSPNWAINMCCGVLGVPIHMFFLTVFVGLMPYNYMCVQTGVLLSKLTSMSELLTWTTMLQMAGVATVALVPGLIVKNKKKNVSSN